MEDFVPQNLNKQSPRLIGKLRQIAQDKLVIFLGATLLLIVAGFFFLVNHKTQEVEGTSANAPLTVTPMPTAEDTPTDTPEPSPTDIPQATVAPTQTSTEATIDCVGPDGKHFSTTQEACNAFNAAWATPTPTLAPTPTPGPLNVSCSASSNNVSADGSSQTNITFTLRDSNNNTINIQSGITISSSDSSNQFSNPYSTDGSGNITVNNLTSTNHNQTPNFTVNYNGNSASTSCVTFN